jgi:hypothetical protein
VTGAFKETQTMRKSMIALCVFSLLASFGAARAELIIKEDFANTALVLKSSASGMNTYELQGPLPAGVSRKVTATNRLLRTAPGVNASGPLNQPWVFSTGVSTMFRNVHWNHYVDLRYTFDDLMDAASVKLKYLNTRACGGRLDVWFIQYDETGRVVWEGGKRLEDWESWPGPYSKPRGSLSDRKWRSYALSLADVQAITQGRKFNTLFIREFDITSEKGSGYIDDVEIVAHPVEEEPCVFPEDTLPPAGSIHAHNNLIWPPNNKWVPVELSGYVRDELSMARDKKGNGVSSAHILINGTETIVLKDKSKNLLNDDGFFKVVYEFKAVKNAMYKIELFAADTNPVLEGGPNEDLIDSTYVHVPANMSPAQ